MFRSKLLDKYSTLHSLIIRRQEFEEENPFPPYNQYKTDINFGDIDQNTLLHYAAMMGDIEKIQYCIENNANIDLKNFNKESAIELALANDHLEAAKYIFEKGANCNDLSLSSCINIEQKEWLSQKISDNNNQCVTESNKLNRAVETGNIEIVKEIIKSGTITNARYYLWLLIAAANNQLQMVKLISGYVYDINGERLFSNSPLMEAVKYSHIEIIDYFLSMKIRSYDFDDSRPGINVNKQNHFKHNALMYTVIYSNNAEVLKIVLKNKPDLMKLDIDGNTVLHLAIINNSNLVNELFAIPELQKLFNIKNIYGETPLDLAIQHRNEIAINYLAPDVDIGKIKKSTEYGCIQVQIKQKDTIKNILYRLRLKYRDTKYFSTKGNCSGLSFLETIYAARGMEQYYFNTSALIASWDGDESNLDVKFYMGVAPSIEDIKRIPQAQYYKNLDDLFEQWTNDVTWFQHYNLEEVDSIPGWDRVQQYNNMVNDTENYEYQAINENYEVIDIDLNNERSFIKSAKKLEELMGYLMRMPEDVFIGFSSYMHATSLHKNMQGMLMYYDPNFLLKTESVSYLERNKIVRNILDYKYIYMSRHESHGDDLGKSNIYIKPYCFKKDFMPSMLAEFEVFNESELPKNKNDADLFYINSPNSFTPLHIAVITKSLRSLEQLLLDGHCSPRWKDANKRTAIDIAIFNKFDEAIELFISHTPYSILEEIYKKDIKEDVINILNRIPKIQVSAPVLPQILINILADNKFNDDELFKIAINKCDKITVYMTLFNGQKLLHHLLSSKQHSKIELALAAGVYIDDISSSGNTCLMGLINVKDLPEKYDLIRLFIKYGSSTSIKNNEGKTVVDLIQESDDPKIREIFLENNLISTTNHFKL